MVPAGYIIDEDRGIVFSRGWPDSTGEDILTHARALAADPRFLPRFHQLFDLRAVVHARASESTVWTLANDSPFGAGARRAVVVSSNVAFGLARMFESLRDGRGETILVTRDIDDAIRWLGLEAARADVLATLERIPDMMPEWSKKNR
jgi:hypothetical protein